MMAARDLSEGYQIRGVPTDRTNDVKVEVASRTDSCDRKLRALHTANTVFIPVSRSSSDACLMWPTVPLMWYIDSS